MQKNFCGRKIEPQIAKKNSPAEKSTGRKEIIMATQLPSGKWRTQVYIGKDFEGKRRYENFIADSADEADFLALEFKLDKERRDFPKKITLGEAIDDYIESKDAVLSPSTIMGYKRIRRTRVKAHPSVP